MLLIEKRHASVLGGGGVFFEGSYLLPRSDRGLFHPTLLAAL